ncbi:hypothetical protein KP79_PYT15419 [Mizuhopecten yessoensis]|uniref:Thiaminase-2/PQQC domain-containing protein n=1 Tax=Mizuhopecten yessoensis TaxID=6573 RepID=A0A210PTL5_MIZYE|nr:hypothetical protein KP79_PYT15419 [Mizuhopecten yessoensis]
MPCVSNEERAFSVQDSIYLFKQQRNIVLAFEKAKESDQKEYLNAKRSTYEKLFLEEFKKWHIDDPYGIKLGQALIDYTEYEKNVVLTHDTIYFLVAMCPCLKLWPWLGKEIADGDHGIYTPWAKANFDPTYVGFEKVDKLIDEAEAMGQIDRNLALEVYNKCMNGEYQFFNSI